MSNVTLYLLSIAIWGSTWLAIKFQLGVVEPAVSVVWRFGLGSIVLFAYANFRHLPIKRPGKDHGWLIVQGAFLFGINYVAAYESEQTLPSGIVAVLFSLAVFFNLIGARLFFKTRIEPMTLIGAIIGCTGVALVFSPQLLQLNASGGVLRGALFAIGSALLAAVGSMVAARNYRTGMPVLQTTAWSMLYGSVTAAFWVAISGGHFRFETSASYVISFIYLMLFGSVIAFMSYLTLMKRIGPGKAGYANVATPIVALGLSTLFEHLVWQPIMIAGVVLCLVGNLFVLHKGRRTR